MSTVSVFLLLLAPFLLHHNLTSYYLTFRYRAQALFNSSKQGNVTVALYISGFLIKLRPNFSWEAQCSLELPVCACTPTGPSRTANLHEEIGQDTALVISRLSPAFNPIWRKGGDFRATQLKIVVLPYLLFRKYVKLPTLENL